MKLSELMAGVTPSVDYEGWVTADDWVLAVDCGTTAAADFTTADDFAVVEMGVTGLDANMNPVTQDKTYIRAGTSTMKTGNQRSFAPSGDSYIGDEFQDFCMTHNIKYGVGSKVVRKYVYFNILNGKGEKGEVSIIVDSDSSGAAGESAGFSVTLKKSGAAPAEYTYTASQGG